MTVTIDRIMSGNAIDKIKAFASVKLDEDFVIHGIMICSVGADDELTLQMPQRTITGRPIDAFHALNREARRQLFSAVLDEYERAVNQQCQLKTH